MFMYGYGGRVWEVLECAQLAAVEPSMYYIKCLHHLAVIVSLGTTIQYGTERYMPWHQHQNRPTSQM